MPEKPDWFDDWSSKANSQLTHNFDERLAEFRSIWEEKNEKQRAAFKDWIGQLHELVSKAPRFHYRMSTCVEFSEDRGEETVRFSIPIRSMVNAIEAWERGECYTPKALGELV